MVLYVSSNHHFEPNISAKKCGLYMRFLITVKLNKASPFVMTMVLMLVPYLIDLLYFLQNTKAQRDWMESSHLLLMWVVAC